MGTIKAEGRRGQPPHTQEGRGAPRAKKSQESKDSKTKTAKVCRSSLSTANIRMRALWAAARMSVCAMRVDSVANSLQNSLHLHAGKWIARGHASPSVRVRL